MTMKHVIFEGRNLRSVHPWNPTRLVWVFNESMEGDRSTWNSGRDANVRQMEEDSNGKKPFEGTKTYLLDVSRRLLPWILALFLALSFQAQLILLRREFASMKLQLTDTSDQTMEDGRRQLSKRSSGDDEKDAVKKVSGIEAAHFQGKFPFQKIEKDGRIGPWSLSSPENAFVALRVKNTELEIATKGMYHVYAQVYYLTSQPSNSYQLLTYNGTEPRPNHRVLSTCACQGKNTIGEVSCYTGFTGTFNRGDRLYLHQIEQNRIINNSNGCSFLGIVLLKKTGSPKRRT